MGYWKSKVLPAIKKIFDVNGPKKAAAAESSKNFDESKEGINKEFEDKKEELGPKVLEIYEASSVEIKTIVKERKEEGIKKQSAGVNKFLEELVKIDFPGSKLASEASSNFGPLLVSGPVFFVFEKVATFLPVEEPLKEEETTTREVTVEPEASAEPAAAPAPAEESSTQEKEVVAVEEEKKEEEEVKKEDPLPPAVEETASTTTDDVTPPAPEPAKAVAEAVAPKS